jgi:hypothetical protein
MKIFADSSDHTKKKKKRSKSELHELGTGDENIDVFSPLQSQEETQGMRHPLALALVYVTKFRTENQLQLIERLEISSIASIQHYRVIFF